MEDLSNVSTVTATEVELRFSPDTGLVPTVRRFVGDFYERVLHDADVVSRLVVATHELLDNAVRYSSDGVSVLRIAVRPEPGRAHVVIETENRSTAERREELMRLLSEMSSAPDRDGFYLVLMGRSAKRTSGSGLGLGRIYAETEMDVRCQITHDTVRLFAEAQFPLTDRQTEAERAL